jgi:hypothetical protein
MSRPHAFARLATLVTLILSSAAASAIFAQSLPPDGLYRVDIVNTSDTEMTSSTQAVDGASGDLSVRSIDKVGNHTATRVYRGERPNTQCIQHGRLPDVPPSACVAFADGTDRVDARCDALSMKQSWRKIDASTWEITTDVVQDMAGPGNSPATARAAFEMAAANGTPEQRAEALAQLKKLPELQRQHEDAMAQVRTAMEEQLRTASPEEAANIRRAQAAMGGGTSGTQVRNHIVQRYTRIADRCPR